MCGISGFFGDFRPTLLTQMNDSIRHRGPDDAGEFFDSVARVGLAQRRLSIIDLSTNGHQPMWDVTRRVCITFNGEIYNYREQRKTLVEQGYGFASSSDTEVLLNLYLRDGTAMLKQLNGIFAFAIWDTRDRTLFLARDGMGVKPLYYTQTPTGLVFASELKAILKEPTVERTLNPRAVHYHLSYLWCPAPHTMLKSIVKLENGHAMVARAGKIERMWQFYELPYDQPIEPIPVAEACRQVYRAVRTAVERQMVADVPVGAFLSGGLDSSSLVAFAREFTGSGRLQCFTIDYETDATNVEGTVSDLAYAKKVARHLDVDLHVVDIAPNIFEHLEKMVYHMDQPLADPAPINVMLISQLAREQGIHVLLSGAGGDDLFTGYRRHYALNLEKAWSWLPQIGRKALKQAAQLAPANTAMGRRLARAFNYADLSGDERIASYFHWIDPTWQWTLYSEHLKQQLGPIPFSAPLIETLRRLPPGTPALNKMLFLESTYFLSDHNLDYTDKMSMAVGVEVRVPLLDPDLVALAARLPVEYKQKGRIGKWIFKKAMESLLPHEVIYRPKTGFGAPLRVWLKHQLKPMVEDMLAEHSLVARGLFDPRGVRAMVAAHESGKIDAAYTILSLVCIELWCRKFL